MFDEVFHVLSKSLSAVCFHIFSVIFICFVFFANSKDHLTDRKDEPFFYTFTFLQKSEKSENSLEINTKNVKKT